MADPLVQQMTTGLPDLWAIPKAIKAAVRSSTTDIHLKSEIADRLNVIGAFRLPGDKTMSSTPAFISISTMLRTAPIVEISIM